MRLTLIIFFLMFKAEAQTSALNIADSLYAYGKYSKAISVLEKASNKTVAYPKMAANYKALGNISKAIYYYEQTIKLLPKQELNLFQLAKLYQANKDYEKAKTILLELIDLDYKNPNYHYQLGKVQQQLGDEFAAQSRFKSAFDLDQSHQKAIYELSKYALKKGHSKSFNSILNIGLKNDSLNKGLISLKGQFLFAKKNYKSALNQFKTLLRLNENTQFVNYKTSHCYEQLYQYENAIRYLKAAINFDKNNVTYLFKLAELYQKTENFKDAETIYALALKLSDRSLENEYLNFGIVLNRLDKPKAAIKAFKKVLTYNPKNSRIHFYILNTKLSYYEDYQSKIDAIHKFKERFPDSPFNRLVDYKLKELISEDFNKTD